MTAVDDVLAHYGVKGMKWGVRKDRPAEDVSVSQRPGQFIKTTGGRAQPASEDARTAAVSRQKAKASTTDALSNDELQKLVTRMNLERQYQQLAFESDRRSLGRKFIDGLMGNARYGGKEKRKFSDPGEEYGKSVGDMIKKTLDERRRS